MNYINIKNELKEYIFTASSNDTIGSIKKPLNHIIEYFISQTNDSVLKNDLELRKITANTNQYTVKFFDIHGLEYNAENITKNFTAYDTSFKTYIRDMNCLKAILVEACSISSLNKIKSNYNVSRSEILIKNYLEIIEMIMKTHSNTDKVIMPIAIQNEEDKLLSFSIQKNKGIVDIDKTISDFRTKVVRFEECISHAYSTIPLELKVCSDREMKSIQSVINASDEDQVNIKLTVPKRMIKFGQLDPNCVIDKNYNINQVINFGETKLSLHPDIRLSEDKRIGMVHCKLMNESSASKAVTDIALNASSDPSKFPSTLNLYADQVREFLISSKREKSQLFNINNSDSPSKKSRDNSNSNDNISDNGSPSNDNVSGDLFNINTNSSKEIKLVENDYTKGVTNVQFGRKYNCDTYTIKKGTPKLCEFCKKNNMSHIHCAAECFFNPDAPGYNQPFAQKVRKRKMK